MDLNCTRIILAQASAPAAQPNMGDMLRNPMVPMLLIMVAFMWIMSRSQKKKAQEHANLLKTVKPGDKIRFGQLEARFRNQFPKGKATRDWEFGRPAWGRLSEIHSAVRSTGAP